VGVTWDSDELLEYETNGGEHGRAAVFDFGFAEPLHVEVLGEAERVEAYISYPSGGVGWGLDEWEGFGHGVE